MNPLWDLLKESILGSPPGVQRRLVHTWPWPHWVTVLIMALGLTVVIGMYVRERAPRSVRIVAALLRSVLLLVVVVVLGYGWTVVTDLTDLPDLLVIVDDSTSMMQADVGPPVESTTSANPPVDRVTRFQWTQDTLATAGRGWLDQFRDRYRVKLFRIAADVRSVTTLPDDTLPDPRAWTLDPDLPQHGASRLGNALRSILDGQRGRPTAAAVLLTDGITTDGKSLSEVAAYARRLDIPMFVVGVGNDRPAMDVRISDVLADDVVFVGDVVHFDVRITGTGFQGKSVKTQLRFQDRSEILAEKKQTVADDSTPLNVRLSFRPEVVGEFDIVIEADAGADDANPGNNRIERHLSVRDEVIRVLYVQQYPSYDFRYLKTLLERGLQRGGETARKSIELAVVLQEADAEYSAIDSSALRTFPVDRDELFRYDVVLFGDVDAAFFSDSLLRNLADFVTQRGGGLVFLSGPRHTPWSYRGTALAELMPVDPDTMSQLSGDPLMASGFRPMPTALSQDSSVLQLSDDPSSVSPWLGFPELTWVAQAPDLRPAARILAEARGRDGSVVPLIGLQFVGAGKVVMLLSDEFYRLSRHADGDVYYARFWLQLLRYLSRGKLLGTSRTAELLADQEAYALGDTVALSVRFLDERQAPAADNGTTIQIEQRGGPRRSVRLERDPLRRGVFRTTLDDLAEGEYRVWLASPTLDGQPPATRFVVTAPRGESARTEMDVAELKQTAKLARGKFYTPATADRLPGDLPQGRQVRIQSLPPQPIWNSPLWPAMIVVLLTGEWLLRKKGGML